MYKVDKDEVFDWRSRMVIVLGPSAALIFPTGRIGYYLRKWELRNMVEVLT